MKQMICTICGLVEVPWRLFLRMDFRNDNASYLYVHRLCYRSYGCWNF